MATKKAFETYRVQLQMRSQAVNTVYLNRITAPEYLILQHVHGKEAVRKLEKQGDDIERRISEDGRLLQRVRPLESLTDYLTNKYNKGVFTAVFPGTNPVLPYTYADAGLLDDADPSVADYGDGWEEVAPAYEEPVAVKGKPMTSVKEDKNIDLIGASEKKKV